MKICGRRVGLISLVLATVGLFPQSAAAWSYQGHMLVGAVADQLLSTRARAGLQSDIGLSLEEAAPWGDCVKGVVLSPQGFVYASDTRRSSTACARFETQPGLRAMQDYVARNWDTCGQRWDCHKTYHFTDVAYQHSHYRSGYVGTNGHDLVHAVRAAVAKLQGQAVPAPFNIASRAEALLLLIHFVGDLHQPLHVGAVYLDGDAQAINPDAPGISLGAVFATRGGNSLELGRRSDLHALWDDIPNGLRAAVALDAMVRAARDVPASRASLDVLVNGWVHDTLEECKSAFFGIHFRTVPMQSGTRVWQVIFDDEADYRMRLEQVQLRQLVRAGSHLAQLLNAIYQ